jgi:hypothetical protein
VGFVSVTFALTAVSASDFLQLDVVLSFRTSIASSTQFPMTNVLIASVTSLSNGAVLLIFPDDLLNGGSQEHRSGSLRRLTGRRADGTATAGIHVGMSIVTTQLDGESRYC